MSCGSSNPQLLDPHPSGLIPNLNQPLTSTLSTEPPTIYPSRFTRRPSPGELQQLLLTSHELLAQKDQVAPSRNTSPYLYPTSTPSCSPLASAGSQPALPPAPTPTPASTPTYTRARLVPQPDAARAARRARAERARCDGAAEQGGGARARYGVAATNGRRATACRAEPQGGSRGARGRARSRAATQCSPGL